MPKVSSEACGVATAARVRPGKALSAPRAAPYSRRPVSGTRVPSTAARRWRLKSPAPEAVQALERRGIARVLATLLVARGHGEPERAEAHLRASPMGLHDPGLLPGMAAACERIARA